MAERYVPAAGRAWLTRLYDPVTALTMREGSFRPALVSAVLADPRPERVLDLGCGTGTLTVALAEAGPGLTVLGVDGDEQVLAAARVKGARLGERVGFVHASAEQLPVDDVSVDVIVASLLLHHLRPDVKRRALVEARRVLTRSGRLVVADWGRPRDPLMHAGFFALRCVDGFANTADHAAGRLPSLLVEAGFAKVAVTRRWRTAWGSLELITAEAD